MRWAEELSRFNFTIRYRPGREGTLPDVFSRREQDMPVEADARYTHREAQLLSPAIMKGFPVGSLHLNALALAPLQTPDDMNDGSPDLSNHNPLPAMSPIGRLWQEAKEQDTHLSEVKQSILRGDRRFPPEEYRVEEIVDERWRRYGRGEPRQEYRVRWTGWDGATGNLPPH